MSDLAAAVTKDMAEIRETDLSRPGAYRAAYVDFGDGWESLQFDLFVDRLGRVVTPGGLPWTKLHALKFLDDQTCHKILRKELRYAGDKVEAQVAYLEAEHA